MRESGGILMLNAGQVLYDSDPRYRGRKVEIIYLDGSYARCKSGPREVKVRLANVFFDDQPRRSGYSTVPPKLAVTNSPAALAFVIPLP